MKDALLSELDDLLVRIRVAHQRPAWRRRLLSGLAITLQPAEIRVLRAVERGAGADDAPCIGDVAEDLGIEHSTASRAVAKVIANGFLTKSVCEGDQRRSRLVLTDEGRRALVATSARRQMLIGQAVSAWSDADLQQLTRLLGRLADDFDSEDGV